MPSPFPGMDPYLEDALWKEVHTYLITAIASDLNAHLPPDYRATVEQSTYIATAPLSQLSQASQSGGEAGRTGGFVGAPDVSVLGDATRGGESKVLEQATSSSSQAQLQPERGSVLMAVASPVEVEVPEPVEVVERWLEVRQASTNQVITAIEILSPTNKLDPRGREQYERKRNRILQSQTHLVEIDLIRAGRTFPILHMPPSRYRILISQSHTRPGAKLYPFNLPQPIPQIAVPLLPEDGEVPLQVQPLLNAIYDQGRYHLAIDYTAPVPPPALTPEEEEWVKQLQSRS